MFSNKKYSKFIYLFLAVLFVYNSFGYLFLYFPVKTIIKQVVQKTLNEKNNDNDDLSVMVFNADGLKSNKYDFIWIEADKEFKFNGRMYDVKYKEVKKDSIYYTCYFDSKENILEKLLSEYLINNKKDINQRNISSVFLFGLFYEEAQDCNSKFYYKDISNIPLFKNENVVLNHITDIPTPPPKFFV